MKTLASDSIIDSILAVSFAVSPSPRYQSAKGLPSSVQRTDLSIPTLSSARRKSVVRSLGRRDVDVWSCPFLRERVSTRSKMPIRQSSPSSRRAA